MSAAERASREAYERWAREHYRGVRLPDRVWYGDQNGAWAAWQAARADLLAVQRYAEDEKAKR